MDSALSGLERLREQRRLQSVEFPLTSLLTLYTQAYKSLYLNGFENLLELIRWLSPISSSTYEVKSVPIYLLNYEINELAKHLHAHPSQIYQELTAIYSTQSNLGELK